MSEKRQHEEEIRRQAKAEVDAGQVVPGSGRRGNPRRMAQMVSVRLDGELVGKLRAVAKERNVSLSELLREGAQQIVQDAYKSAQPRMSSYTIYGAEDTPPTGASGGAYAVH